VSTRNCFHQSIAVLLVAACLAATDDGAAPPPPPPPPAGQAHVEPPPAPQGQQDQVRNRLGALELGRRAVLLLRRGQAEAAEKLLRQALQLDPANPAVLYNLACARAMQDDAEGAMGLLEQAADAGFGDFDHLEADPDLERLRGSPRFARLMGRRDELQRKAAGRAVAAMKRRFGAGYLYEVDAAEKLIFATNVDRETLQSLRRSLQRQAASQWEYLFTHRPDQFITVVVPSAGDYKRLVPLGGIAGFYDPTSRTLIARQLGQVMTHEFTHALHAADVAPLGQQHAIWLTEGLASLYEAAEAREDSDELVPRDNFRLGLLQSAGRQGRLLSLEKLLALKQPQFVRLNHLAYGQSSSLLLYLYERDLLRPFYDAYKAGYNDDPTGRVALEEVTGMTLADLEKAWTQWMARRRAPSLKVGVNGLLLGVRFVPANDGMKVAAVVPLTPAQSAGVRAGDVLVGIDGQEVRDLQTLAPLLNRYRPGDTLTLRLRRDRVYLDVPVELQRRDSARSRWRAKRAEEEKAATPKDAAPQQQGAEGEGAEPGPAGP
jgi:hypothetical protein